MRIEANLGVQVIKKASDIFVSQQDIDRYKRLKGPQNALNKHYGEGNWGDEEVKRYIRKTKFAVYTKQGEQAQGKGAEERLAAYLQTFEAVTPNDLEMLRAMASIEVTVEAIRQQIPQLKDPNDVKKLADAQTKLLTEHRQLQVILGIDKAGREKSKKQKSAIDEIQDLVEEGARFIEEQLVKISHCGIEMGWLLYHFDEMGYRFETRCPRRGEGVQVSTSASEPVSHNGEGEKCGWRTRTEVG